MNFLLTGVEMLTLLAGLSLTGFCYHLQKPHDPLTTRVDTEGELVSAHLLETDRMIVISKDLFQENQELRRILDRRKVVSGINVEHY